MNDLLCYIENGFNRECSPEELAWLRLRYEYLYTVMFGSCESSWNKLSIRDYLSFLKKDAMSDYNDDLVFRNELLGGRR